MDEDGNPTSALLWHVLNTISNYYQFVTEDGVIQFLYSSMISPLSMKFYFISSSWVNPIYTHISSSANTVGKINSKLPAKALSRGIALYIYTFRHKCECVYPWHKKAIFQFHT